MSSTPRRDPHRSNAAVSASASRSASTKATSRPSTFPASPTVTTTTPSPTATQATTTRATSQDQSARTSRTATSHAAHRMASKEPAVGNPNSGTVKRERQRRMKEIMDQRNAIAAKLAEAQRVAQQRKQLLLQQFGSLGPGGPSPRSARRRNVGDVGSDMGDGDDTWQGAGPMPFDAMSTSSRPQDNAGPQWSTPYPHKASARRRHRHMQQQREQLEQLRDDGDSLQRRNMELGRDHARPDSADTIIPERFLGTIEPEDADTTLQDVRAWRENYIHEGGMNPATLQSLHEVERRCTDAAKRPNTHDDTRDHNAHAPTATAAAHATNTRASNATQFAATQPEPNTTTAMTTSDLAVMLQQLRNQDAANATTSPEMIRLLIQQELARTHVTPVNDSAVGEEATEEERMEARRLRQLHQQAEILKKEAELKRLQRELDAFEQPQPSEGQAPPLTPPEQATDVLNPGPYDRESGFVIYFDFACRLPSWLRRCSLSYQLYAGGKPQSRVQTCLPVNAEPMEMTTSSSSPLMQCIFHKAFFAIRQCPPLPTLHLIIELRNRTATSDEGTLAAWCKLYFFSQKQLVSGRWRLRLLQPPKDESCFSTDTLVAPSFHGADLCVRLVDGRAQSQHDALDVEPKRHLYLPNGVVGQDVVYLLQLKAKQTEDKLKRQQLMFERQKKEQEEEQKKLLAQMSKKASVKSGLNGTVDKSSKSTRAATAYNSTNDSGETPAPLNLSDLSGLSVASAFHLLSDKNALPLAINITAVLGFLQNAEEKLAARNALPTWACVRLSLVLPSNTNMAALTLSQTMSELFYISADSHFTADDSRNLTVHQRLILQDIELNETADINIMVEVLAVTAREDANTTGGENQLSSQWKSMLQEELPQPTADDVEAALRVLWGVTPLASIPLLETSIATISLSPCEDDDEDKDEGGLESRRGSKKRSHRPTVTGQHDDDNEDNNATRITAEIRLDVVDDDGKFANDSGSRAHTHTLASTAGGAYTSGVVNSSRQQRTRGRSEQTRGSDGDGGGTGTGGGVGIGGALTPGRDQTGLQLDQALKLIPDGVFIYKERTPPAEVFQSTSGFDLYIDGARFLPSNATITKVVGRIFNVGKQVQKKDITTSLDLDSDVFNPTYNFRLEFREPIFTPTSTLVVQVYTIDRFSNELVIIGYAAINLFCLHGTNEAPDSDTLGQAVALNEGGHQIRLHSQPFAGSDRPHVSVLAEKPVVPCASLLVRLLPALKDDDGNALSMADIPKAEWQSSGLVVPAPLYRSAAYASVACAPVHGEPHIYQQLVQREVESVRNVCAVIADEKQKKTLSTDKRRHHFIRNRLTRSTGKAAQFMDLSFIVPVMAVHGLHLFIERAVNLPKSKPAVAVASLCPPASLFFNDSVDPDDRSIQWTQGWSVDEPMCALRSPIWTDVPLTFKDKVEAKSMFVIEVFAIDYKGASAIPQAHTYFSCVKAGQFVACGGFRLPLFLGKANVDVLASMMEIDSPQEFEGILDQAVKKKQLKVVEGGYVVVHSADARISLDLACQHELVDAYPRFIDKKSKTITKSKPIPSVLKSKQTMDDLEAKVETIMAHTIFAGNDSEA
ncbi:hypothetical protein PTSG_12409 [Salpingoeca rosetta]|uniref:Uncharacterized protein n=1 Tax=Salpingoeca rosetta (strain ATCC 50818 / BSB-021) TaxID=946362 RepID=F2UC63_SALR5|nr:uncharacterized protein PTSG_12409 [Salpingoeca rosetta]EGD74170.1 hypothetical protein PTSG_12409 [Salpingoeca rosetta]|eukprot:XP_004993070.1 hypothetical protein PTSG_12409 [Salpingoeca rosetta]